MTSEKQLKNSGGGSDYEYSTTVRAKNVTKLYEALGVPPGDKHALLQKPVIGIQYQLLLQ